MLPETIHSKGREWSFRIQTLSEAVWEGRAKEQDVRDWLNGFVGNVCDAEIERYYGLYLLQQFIYFGEKEIDALLYAMFRDHILYPRVQACLESNASMNDLGIRQNLELMVAEMRIVPVGGVSESATMLSYRLRQIAGLPPTTIRNMSEVFAHLQIFPCSIKHLLLTDDFLGTGDQLCSRHHEQVKFLKDLGIKVDYVALVAMQRGLEAVRAERLFDNVNAVVVLDRTYSISQSPCVHMNELDHCSPLSRDECSKVIQAYGEHLLRGHSLGYKSCGLLIGFHHNTPDNSLPIFWVKSKTHRWTPPFERSNKVDTFSA